MISVEKFAQVNIFFRGNENRLLMSYRWQARAMEIHAFQTAIKTAA